MSHIYSHQQTISTTPAVVTVASLAEARKLANKERRQSGRERHEERKEVLKSHESFRKLLRHHHDTQRQEKRREDGTRAFTGRNLYNHRKAIALHVRAADNITVTTTATAAADAEDGDHHHLEDEEAYDTEEEEEVRFVAEEEQHQQHQQATSGAMLLAMARPAKTHTRRQRLRCPPPVMTDGETFEIVEIDGRLVALDEDGWEILPDENAEVSLLYSDIVRGTAL
ncbi:hypothetical protein F5888DRAFT_1633010 [Russula emetica]|nr:hypothetical protein F5888DRAFT_1633010 [Russula emetica]